MILTPEQAQAQTTAIRSRSKSDSRVIALRHTGSWSGPGTLKINDEDYVVISCISDLQIREALGHLEENNRPGLLLCDVDPATLGEDVLARLVRRQIHHLQKDETLRGLFNARSVDARILSSSALINALMSGTGYSPAPGGTLDLQFAWIALLKNQLGVEVTEISFTELLRWTTIPSARSALLKMAPELRAELAKWLAPTYLEAPRHLFRALESELGTDMVALGRLLGFLVNAEQSKIADAHAAGARLEQYFGNEPLDHPTRQAWYQASSALFEKLAAVEVFQAQGVIQNLDRLIERIRLQACAHLSDHSLLGLEQRLAAAGEAIGQAGKVMSDGQIMSARTALDKVAQHRLAADQGLRQSRLQMALRLVLWLRANNLPGPAATLSQLIDYYSTEGGFIDWARTSVVESDPHPQIKDVLQGIMEHVDSRWNLFQHQFVERLQEWSVEGSELKNVLLIEEILWTVVAPVSRQQPALLIVLDGMSQAVFRELISDLMRRNWVELAAPAADIPRTALVAIPSITEISRGALLSGQLPTPTKGSEKTDFSSNDRLLEQVGNKPQLFLKGDLVEAGRMGLPGTVTQALANGRCNLVGVVVNAVDDSLGSSDQTSYSWALDKLGPLAELMRMASETGRVVILTSDHGHVLDEGSRLVRQPLAETGDRYRLAGGALSEGEMEFRGTRVRAAVGADSVVALASPRRRYQGKRRGYHGGVCPAELVVPCVVLRSSNTEVPKAWEDLPPYEPEWWSLRQEVLMPVNLLAEQPLPAHRRTGQKQAELFNPPVETPQGTSAWIEQLIASSTYQQQARAAVRGAPPVEQIKRFLALLDQRNGRIQRGHLAQQLAMPLIRVDGMIQNYRRLLNVDGYDVLAYDQSSETIVLNLELLKNQFEL